MAWCYRELIQSTGRLDDEIQLISNILKRAGIRKNSRILDFACGTGDVLSGLEKLGFRQLFGLDGSSNMLKRATELKSNVNFSCCRWTQLGSYFNTTKPFDFVFALSVSLPHIDPSDVEKVLSNLRRGMKPGGIICFDFRNWIRSRSGKIIEGDRPEGVFRWCGSFYIENDYFWVDDLCYYDDSKQYVQYRIRKRKKDGYGYNDENFVTVSYNLLGIDDYSIAVQNSGFNEIEISKPTNWPYLVLTATAK